MLVKAATGSKEVPDVRDVISYINPTYSDKTSKALSTL